MEAILPRAPGVLFLFGPAQQKQILRLAHGKISGKARAKARISDISAKELTSEPSAPPKNTASTNSAIAAQNRSLDNSSIPCRPVKI